MNNPANDNLGFVPPRDLVDARLVLHHAALIVAAVGKDLHPSQPDASHKALAYVPALRAVAGPPATDALPVRAALRLHDLTLLLLGVGDEELGRFTLPGRTLDQAEAWLNERLRATWTGAPAVARQVYESFPEHPVGRGAFVPEVDPAALEEIERYFALAWTLLDRLRNENPGAGPPCIWPHHFDAAVLIPVAGGDGEDARSIGVGFSPGDDATAEPYWYVSPWPYPAADRVPAGAALGTWHAEPFFGASLTATVLREHSGEPLATVGAFFAEAIETAHGLIAP